MLICLYIAALTSVYHLLQSLYLQPLPITLLQDEVDGAPLYYGTIDQIESLV